MKKIFFLIIFLSFSMAPVVSGHGLAVTQQRIVNDYLIEFEYDGTGLILAGAVTPYIFEFLDKTNNQQVPYDRLFVKITKQGLSQPTFAANLAPVELLGRRNSRANVALGDIGPYTIELGFYKNDTELAKAAFAFDVYPNPEAEGSKARQYAYIAIFAALLAVIVIESIWLLKKKKKKDGDSITSKNIASE